MLLRRSSHRVIHLYLITATPIPTVTTKLADIYSYIGLPTWTDRTLQYVFEEHEGLWPVPIDGLVVDELPHDVRHLVCNAKHIDT